MAAVLSCLFLFKLLSSHSLAIRSHLCLGYLYTKWRGYSSKGLVDNGPSSHLGWLPTTGVLLQCKFCPVAIVRVLITAVIDTLVYGTNTLPNNCPTTIIHVITENAVMSNYSYQLPLYTTILIYTYIIGHCLVTKVYGQFDSCQTKMRGEVGWWWRRSQVNKIQTAVTYTALNWSAFDLAFHAPQLRVCCYMLYVQSWVWSYQEWIRFESMQTEFWDKRIMVQCRSPTCTH